MKLARLSWMAMLAVAVCFAASTVFAATLPITFELTTYSASADPNSTGIPGTVHGQDGWNTFATGAPGSGVGNIRIASATAPTMGYTPIAGAQSLLINNSASGNANTGTRSQFSGSIGSTPIGLSWLVRVDAFGNASGGSGVLSSGASSGRGIEFGLSNMAVAGSTPIGIAFNDDGGLRYIASGTAGYTAFSGNPTYSVGTVYRVEVLNINATANTFDVRILVDSSDTLVASVTSASAVNTIFDTNIAAPSAGTIGTNVGFYVARRGGLTGNASIDNISVVPEPNSIVILGLGLITSTCYACYRRRKTS